MFTVEKYSDWKDTAQIVHMLLQMMGKVKLARMAAQPEWNHALLLPTAGGFTTGIMPHQGHSFEITFDLNRSEVSARCTSGLSAAFPVEGTHSVAEYYARFQDMLAAIHHGTRISPLPQEVADTTPFDRQTTPLPYSIDHARNYFAAAIFAHNALLSFAAPLRGKKILPQLFWGTFDMTTVIFSGVEKPFGGEGLVERVAFDEQFIEFGFWPGDPATDEPAFFALPYPFLEKDYTGAAISPKEAWYSPEKKEFFLPLRDVLQSDDPLETVRRFCEDVFRLVTKEENWPDVDWYTKPLLC